MGPHHVFISARHPTPPAYTTGAVLLGGKMVASTGASRARSPPGAISMMTYTRFRTTTHGSHMLLHGFSIPTEVRDAKRSSAARPILRDRPRHGRNGSLSVPAMTSPDPSTRDRQT